MNIYESIAKIMPEVPAIAKGKKNSQQGFMYRGIEEILNAFQPLFAKNKVFMVPEVLESNRSERTSSKGVHFYVAVCKVKYKFYAEDGTFVEAITEGEGMDSGDKSTSKAMTMALKCALSQVFCIPTEEDPDGTSPEMAEENEPNPTTQLLDEKEAKILHEIMEKKGINIEASLEKKYGVKTTKELNVQQKVEIMKGISGMPDVK